ncbi:uncharacterized protein LOC100210300 isoform X1 [Hydra vulgaris]|uniref:uncharacterized protein LOC100210300 isoform X1 n=1 Tax=Hydra vulgaris TaxID=6087 RepID=UPI0006414897|nr:uncharacterized protein LOC100210300 [Hydra vulgaris]
MFRSIIEAILIFFAHPSKIFSDTMVDLSGDVYNSDCKQLNINSTTVIASPNFGSGSYPPNKVCAWKIQTKTDSADLTLKIDQFNLEFNKLCSKYDYLMIFYQYAGEETTNIYRVLENVEGYCGVLTNIQPFVANAKTMLVKFVSDGLSSKNYPGFNATLSVTVTRVEPKIDSFRQNKQDLLAPNILVNVTEGDTVNILCQASRALPPATYTFEQIVNGSYISIDPSKIQKLPDGTINLLNLYTNDSGTYVCNASNNVGVDSKMFQLVVKEKCLCPPIIHTSWYSYAPYISSIQAPNKTLLLLGIFPAVLKMMVDDVCGKCEKGHGPTWISWDIPSNSKKQRFNINSDVNGLNNAESKHDMIFPVSNAKDVDIYRGFYCVPILDSPGVALIVTKEDPNASSNAMFISIMNAWPILILVIVFTTLAGIVIWILETYWNEKQFPRSFTTGMGEGFWWAFVSMTTVGYGDIAPVSIPGRLFAVLWILTGLVLIAIFTGVVTTSLTIKAMSNDIILYNATLGALNNSNEFIKGVMRNGIMKNYSNFDGLVTAMNRNEVNGILLDLNVAAFYLRNNNAFRVSKIFPSTSSYCVVLGNDLAQKKFYDTFVQYLSNNSAKVLKAIQENSFTLSAPQSSAAQDSASSIFFSSNRLFVRSVITTTLLLVFFFIFGVLFEYWYLQPRKRMIQAAKNLEIVQSPEVKENAKRARFLKEYLLWEVNEFYDRWSKKLTYLSRKHKLQQQAFLSRGTTSQKVHDTKTISHSSTSSTTLELHNEDEVDGTLSNRSTAELFQRTETKNL